MMRAGAAIQAVPQNVIELGVIRVSGGAAVQAMVVFAGYNDSDVRTEFDGWCPSVVREQNSMGISDGAAS